MAAAIMDKHSKHEEGTYFVWPQPDADTGGHWLTVAHNGQAKHHKLDFDAANKVFTIDAKTITTHDTLEAVVESLKTKSGTWDIPLKEFVDNEVTNIEVGDDMERWVHPLMSNEAAEGLMGDCTDTGTYILRQGRSQNQWVLTVAVEGAAAHYSLNGAYLCILVDKKMYGSYPTKVSELIETLKDSRTTNWFVVLTTPIVPATPAVAAGRNAVPEWKQQHNERTRRKGEKETQARQQYEDAVPAWKRTLNDRNTEKKAQESESVYRSGGAMKLAAKAAVQRMSFFDLKREETDRIEREALAKLQAGKEAKLKLKLEEHQRGVKIMKGSDEMQRQYDLIETQKLNSMASWKKSLYLKRVEPADSMWEACGMDDEEKAELLALPPWQCAITLKKQAQGTVNKRLAEILKQAAQAAENIAEGETKEALGGKFESMSANRSPVKGTASPAGSRRNSVVLESSMDNIMAKRRATQAEADKEAETRTSTSSRARFSELKSGKKKAPAKKGEAEKSEAVLAAEKEKLRLEKELADESNRLEALNEKVRKDAIAARHTRKMQVTAARMFQRAWRKYKKKKTAVAQEQKKLAELEQYTRMQIQALHMQQEQDLILYNQQLAQMQWIVDQQKQMTDHMQLVNQKVKR